MSDSLKKFREISWNNTKFQVLERTQSKLLIAFDNLTLPEEEPRRVEILFNQPINEWATLWSSSTNEWVEHPDKQNPIRGSVVEADAKDVGKLKFSFGGDHKLGWSRWGFSADSFRIV